MSQILLLLVLLILSSGCGTAQSTVANNAPAPDPVVQRRLDHIIIIFPENHTFDLLFGKFPGANGLDSPGGVVPQVDQNGAVFATLPPVPGTKLPDNLPNAPFLINPFYSEADIYPTPVHRYYQNLMQLNGDPLGDGRFGNFRMNMFVSGAGTDEGTLAMGYYDTQKLPLYPYAREFVLMDNFFVSQFGGSMLGHFWLIAAQTPIWPNADPSLVLQPVFDAAGRLVGINNSNGVVTPDGYAIEDAQPFYPPFWAGTPDDQRVPPQTNTTIGDLLNQRGVSWAWYSQGWNDAVAGNPSPDFIYHHQPFVYFEAYKPGTSLRANHLKDVDDFHKSLRDGTLPAVSFIKPMAGFDEHSGQSPILRSEEYVVELIEAVRNSPYWESSAIFVTYDDFGGFYDHVPPVMEDRWGPGNRVPCLLVSPLARQGYVDHTLYNTQSILRLIEDRFGLPALSERDRRATSVIGAFDLERFPNLMGP